MKAPDFVLADPRVCVAPAGMQIHQWASDELAVVYDPRRARTHLVDALGAEVLLLCRHHGLTLRQLCDSLAPSLCADPGQNPDDGASEALLGCIVGLEGAGLLQRRSLPDGFVDQAIRGGDATDQQPL